MCIAVAPTLTFAQCNEFEQIVEAGTQENFRSIRSKRYVDGADFYFSNVYLPRANRCVIDYLDGLNKPGSFRCRWLFLSRDSLQKGVSEISSVLSTCMGRPFTGGSYKGVTVKLSTHIPDLSAEVVIDRE